MPVQKVTNFTGGIQNRLPAHRIEQNEVQEGLDADFSYGDVRPDYSIGGDGGGLGYFYEAGGTWISSGGVGGVTYTNLDVSSDTTISANQTVANPVTVPFTVNLTINSTKTLTIEDVEQGLAQVNSFVEFNDDLYMGRDEFEIAPDGNNPQVSSGSKVVTVGTSEARKCVVGDLVEGVGIADDSIIDSINTGAGTITLDKNATASNTGVRLKINTIPVRMVDGDIRNVYKLGIDKPIPDISISQNIADDTVRASGSHSEKFYSVDYPIPFQYGVAFYDSATLAESPLSDLSDRDISQSAISGSKNSSPFLLDLNLTTQGKYAVYRVGGTSAILKKVCDFYDAGTSNIAIGIAISTNQITITPSSLPAGGHFRVKWLAYNGRKYGTSSGQANAYTEGITAYDSAQGAVTLHGYLTSNNASTNDHYLDLICQINFKDSQNPTDTRDYIVKCVNLSNNVETEVDIIDFSKPRALIDIEPFTDSGDPPHNGKFLKEVNNFFFCAVGKRLHISNFSAPNSWPVDGYVDFDANITGFSDRGGELLVFTEYGLYRCYGNAANEFRKVKVGTVQGVPSNLHNCISKVRDATVYVSQSGICFFAGDKVDILTQSKLGEFSTPSPNRSSNISGVIDDQYYLLADNINGWKLDMRFGVQRLSKTSLRAQNLHYRGLTNKLYTETGYIGGGDINKFSFKTRDFDGGDITAEKYFSKVSLTGSDFSGKINIYVDGGLIDTFNVPNVVSELNRSLYMTSARLANYLALEFIDCSGKISEVGVSYEFSENFVKMIFNAVDITYTGSPVVTFKIDNLTKISNVTLPDVGQDKTGSSTLFFPALTEGIIPHLIANETESSRVISFKYNAEAV